MKTRFSTLDLVAAIRDLEELRGLRVNNVYDINSKTYLIRFHKPADEGKAVVLLESGIRLHPTEYDWPKSMYPSGFAMKLRKHIKQKRLESVVQVGLDRIVDLQFGSDTFACHVILELYDRGNIVLTDHEGTILNVLRPRTDKDTDVRFAVRQRYPYELARQGQSLPQNDELKQWLSDGKPGEPLRKILMGKLVYGPALLEHALLDQGIALSAQLGKQVVLERDWDKVWTAIEAAETLYQQACHGELCKGYVISKLQQKPVKPQQSGDDTVPAESDSVEVYQEFHPLLFAQHAAALRHEFATFSAAVDAFYSAQEAQKLDLKAVQQEHTLLKKLQNIRSDHERRVCDLQDRQQIQDAKAELILLNKDLVDRAILVLRNAIANKLSWDMIDTLVNEATEEGDPVASSVQALHLERNHVTLSLQDPYSHLDDDDDSDNPTEDGGPKPIKPSAAKPMLVEIDLSLGAFQNARKYFTQKAQAAVKEEKTLDASKKALKDAERKTVESLKQMEVKTSINKTRKTFWFEKFFWFISLENYLVVGGRDQQQNEMVVKRYLRPGDVYVHADIRGASSVVVKNPSGAPVPPKTLNEAGTMAICYSAAWEAKVVTSAWWVEASQVSKTAQTGEYLTTGSFMVRGRKNFLPPSQLVLGFGLMFRLEEESIPNHKGERKVMVTDEDEAGRMAEETTYLDLIEENEDGDEEPGDEEEKKETEQPQITPDSIEKNGQVSLQEEKEVKDPAGDSGDSEHNDRENEASASEAEFPDVEIQLTHHLRVDSVGSATEKSLPAKPGKQRPETKEKEAGKAANQQAKRGQRHKAKKMKEKYRNQTEEERELRLQLLGSAGAPEPSAGTKKKRGKGGKQPPANKKQPLKSRDVTKVVQEGERQPQAPPSRLREPVIDEGGESDHEDEAETENAFRDELANTLDSLTGKPIPEDLLLFAVPVCAPYPTLANYKFKVKMTPGTGKKGKATKTAIQLFLRDKTVTQRELDLLKSLQDTELSRNLPGKVKVSAPKIQMAKKK